jgi:SAM-dependent methyltransferase
LSEGPPDYVSLNRESWERGADEYQREHGEQIGGPDPLWGLWGIHEQELGVLGDVADKDVLELGCGAGQWSIRLAGRGARIVGLDYSEKQLEHARSAMAAAGVEFPLVFASAEAVPFPDASFDLVFADHGANRFADPYRWIPEAARLLRRGGLLAFSGSTPFEALCWDAAGDRLTTTLQRDYFGLHRIDDPDGYVEFELPYGEWIRLFRTNGLIVESLIETRPPEGATSTYRSSEEAAWARRWPMEQIWVARREA